MATQETEHARWRRTVAWITGFVLVELGLALIAYLSPAVRVLMRPVYVLVAIGYLLAIRAASRRRHGDRRHSDRRHRRRQAGES